MWINVKNPKILANFHIGLRLQHRAQLQETPLRTYCLHTDSNYYRLEFLVVNCKLFIPMYQKVSCPSLVHTLETLY